MRKDQRRDRDTIRRDTIVAYISEGYVPTVQYVPDGKYDLSFCEPIDSENTGNSKFTFRFESAKALYSPLKRSLSLHEV